MINPDNELFIWGPIDGKPCYPSYFCISIGERTHLKYKFKWPSFTCSFFKDKMTVILDKKELYLIGEDYFNYWILNDKKFKKLNLDYKKAVNNLIRLQKPINKEFLKKLSDEELYNLFKKWNKTYLNFWDVGLVPEISNWGGEAILERFLKKNFSEKEFIELFEKLSAPIKLSFYQEEELDLLKIALNKKDKNYLLKNHAKKYFWIKNSYHKMEVLDENYFEKVLKEFKDVNKKIINIENFSKQTIKKKKDIIKKYSLNKKIVKISERLSYSIAWQDSRKARIFKANHYMRLFIEEVSKRYELKIEDLELTLPEELLKLMKRKILPKNIRERKEFCAILIEKKKVKMKSDDKTKEFCKLLLKKDVQDVKEIKGLVTSHSEKIIKGKVRILLTARNADKMQKGEILVAPMTSPEFIVAMRKSSAIITDEGGMTCHAAIVSRELGIPCIVGTKIATKVLKQGQLVEINTKKGEVKIIE